MASQDPVRMLAPVTGPSQPEPASEIAIVFEQREKVANLFQRLASEHRSSAVQLARDMAGEEIEKFNFVAFVGKWKPVADRVEEVRSVLSSFLLMLDQLMATYESEQAEALLPVLEKKRDELEKTLREQHTEAAEITRRLDDIQQKIADIAKRLPASQAASPSTGAPTQRRQQPPTPESKT